MPRVTLPSPRPIHDQGIINHIVIIVQENRSFDNLFSGFPGADSVLAGNVKGGGSIPLQPVPLEYGIDVGHFHTSFVTAYDSGANDGFNSEGTFAIAGGRYGPVPAPTNYAYAHVPQSETLPYLVLATHFTLADRMFASNSGPSFPAHQYLIAGQSDDADEVPSVGPWGCDAPPGTLVAQLQPNGTESAGVFPCFDYRTLGDLMDAAGITWRYYAPGAGSTGYLFSAYDAVRHIRFGPDWTAKVISPETTVLTDIAGGNLAQVSWVIPSFPNSDHVLAASNTGPQWLHRS